MLSDPTTTLNEDQIESLSYIRNGGTHLLELINQVLDLSAVETGNINLHTENIKIAELVDDCLGLIRVTADQRDIRMEAVSESANTIALADRQRLKEILLNLLSNAVKYNTVGGSITVRTVCPDDDLIRITVEDTGPGIPEENLDRLFVPFDRLGANASEVEGTGIGLTIAKRFVEHMGGAIGVSSVVGEGSRFWLDLPRAPAAGTVDAVDRSEEDLFSGPPSGVARDRVTTVLCIEDNVANMRLLKRIFATRPEFLMIEESTGEDGLKRAELERPDIILMDIGLPGMDGYETLKALQASPDCKDIPVIALSANAMSHDLDRGLAAGFFNYLTKPVVITDLVRCLKEAAAS